MLKVVSIKVFGAIRASFFFVLSKKNMQNILLIKIFAISLSQKVKAILTNNPFTTMKKGCYDIEFSNSMGGEWKLYTMFNVYNKKDEKTIKELEEQLARQGHFVRLTYDETMTRLMNE